MQQFSDLKHFRVRREGDRLMLKAKEPLLFAPGSSVLSQDAQEALTEFAFISEQVQHRAISIVGHSERGESEASAEELSLARALQVKNFLVSHGVPASALSVKGDGSPAPVHKAETEEARLPTRRVDVDFTQ